ncbi:MAG: NAD(P)-binding domain-containing protein [Rhodobacteraceae bacterium]|nr:NAD(P)-binding domain-containing protein [Paracoccaceae bacterium]
MRIGVIGTGTIATALVRGLAGQGHVITLSQRSAANSAMLAGEIAEVSVAENQAVLDASDVVFLGLMAGAAPQILGALRFRADQQVISLMAGASLAQTAPMVAPARAVALMLPYPGIAEGGSAVLALGKTGLIETLFAPRNQIFPLKDDAELAAYLCAQAVLSPLAQMVADASDWLGSLIDDPAQGEAFLRALVASNLSAGPAKALVSALETEGGYNQRLRIHLHQAGTRASLLQGLDRLARGE